MLYLGVIFDALKFGNPFRKSSSVATTYLPHIFESLDLNGGEAKKLSSAFEFV
jgi:hypothetical protein